MFYNQFAGGSLERIAALSDGVFAIAMTLLVLDLHVPAREALHSEHDLIRTLLTLAPHLLVYLMSFLTLGIFWVGQQTQVSHLARSDRNLAWLHIAFLAVVSLMPFTTSLMADFIIYRSALLVYWFNIVLLGLMLFLAWHYAAKHGLVRPDLDAHLHRSMLRRVALAQTLYAVGAALCVFSTWWSIGFIMAVQLNYAIAPRIRLLRWL